MTVQNDIATVLLADSTLMDILTGGLYEQDEVGEISRTDTPDAYDANDELQPCALVAEGTELPRGPVNHTDIGFSVQSPLNIFFYQRDGYDQIALAMDRVFTLLAGQKIGSSTWRIEYENSIKNQKDTGLEASLGVARYMVVRLRS